MTGTGNTASRSGRRLFWKPVPAAIPLMVMLMMLWSACATPEPSLQLEMGLFAPAEIGNVQFFEHFAEKNRELRSVSGRASVQVSEPGHTERLIVRFRSDRHYSLLFISNHLGIEGGRIFSDPDSVIVYDRLENVAHKMSHDDAAWFYFNGIGAMNLIRMLYPVTDPDHIDAIYESEDFYLVVTDYGDRHYIERDHFVLRRTELQAYHPEAYSTFQFDHFADIEGYHLPRRIQILSSDQKSNIFLVIRALEVNPSELEFDPGVPGDVDIIRL